MRDGEVIAAVQEERFTRVKHDASFPKHAIAYCLAEAGIEAADLDAVAFYDKPLQTFERLLESYLGYAPRGLRSFLTAMPVWLKQKLWTPDVIRRELGDYEGRLLFTEHHQSHAASAFYPSPFERAAFLTVDGVGEWATTSYGVGHGNQLELQAELHFPHSLGLLYSAFTYFCGFKVNTGEYKLMGLAPYGEPRYVQTILDHLIDLKEDGSFRLHPEAFTYTAGLRMTGRRFVEMFGGPPRRPESEITQREMDLARSVQAVTEEAMLRMARHVRRTTGERALCLAGGVALNCVANGIIHREGIFDEIWIQPAAGDAGGALGAALAAQYIYLDQARTVAQPDSMQGSFLGPDITDADSVTALESRGVPFERLDEQEMARRVAGLLASGLSVGWAQGRMEYGPRALGARSILADPRGTDVQKRVNLQIKFRESFRPFAPAVLRERVGDHFGIDADSPYMLLVAPVLGAEVGGSGFDRLTHMRSALPAVTHVDGSARVQTVSEEHQPAFYRLLRAFEAETGCPVLVNTSFNVRNEPIVSTADDAVRCFLATNLDVLVVGPYLALKTNVPEELRSELDLETAAQAYGLD
ncbi:carbamoyltransferase [soil metagenome]